MKKRVFAVILGSVMAVSLMACGTKDEGAKDGTKTYTVGISQFAEHGSLDNCREGFIEGLKEAGFEEGKNLEIKEENAAADQGTAKQISDGFVSDDVDLICGIATPSAQSAYNSAMNTEIPVIYTAVTDPKAAKLANEDGTPVGEVTGTSDELPIKEQLEMIRKILPDAEKIGILYTTSEVNSVSAIETYEELAGDYGFEIVKKGVTQTADISLATEEILTEETPEEEIPADATAAEEILTDVILIVEILTEEIPTEEIPKNLTGGRNGEYPVLLPVFSERYIKNEGNLL